MSDTLGGTMGADSELTEFVNSRAEAKKAHMERLSHLRAVDERERDQLMQDLRAEDKSEPKQTAFQIAVSVANAADSKVNSIFAKIRQLFYSNWIFAFFLLRMLSHMQIVNQLLNLVVIISIDFLVIYHLLDLRALHLLQQHQIVEILKLHCPCNLMTTRKNYKIS